MDKRLSLKIKQLQWIFCIMVVVLHSGENLQWSGIEGRNIAQIIEYFFCGGVCQIAVPAFYLISAYLFYWNCDGGKTIKRKLRARIHTLLIPYLLWNTIWEIYYVILWKIGFTEKDFSGHSAVAYISDILLSTNTALWFIKWLMVFSILSPVIGRVLKNRKLFWPVFALALSIVIIFKLTYFNGLYWLPLYLLGGYLGTHGVAVKYGTAQKGAAWYLVYAFLLAAMVAAVVIFHSWEAYMALRYFGSLIFLALFISAPLCDIQWRIMDYSYPIYCMHVPVCGAIKHFIRGAAGVVITPVIAVGVVFVFVEFIKKYFPFLFYLLFGKKIADRSEQ